MVASAIALGCWELLSRGEVLPPKYFPAMSDAIRELGAECVTWRFWDLVVQTTRTWALGVLLVTAIAVPLGIAIGSSETLFRMTRVVFDVFRAVPPIVLIPLFILLGGATIKMQLMVIVWGTIWSMLIQTVYGVRSVDPVALDTARAFRVTLWHRFWFVRLAGSLPMIWTGLRITASGALFGAIVSELIGGAPGLGNAILVAQESAAPSVMYALIFATGLLGVFMNGVFALFEGKALHWHHSIRGRTA